MKIISAKTHRFLLEDFKTFCAILLYGPDTGLVSERCEQIIKQCIDTKDKKNIALNKTNFQYKEICIQPSLLVDEVTSLSFFTNKKVIIIDNVEGSFLKPLEEILEHNKDNIIVFKAGDLPISSAIRKFFETKKNMAALPCYADNTTSVKQKISKLLLQNNLTLEDPTIINDIAEMLRGDHKIIESEIKKIALYYNNQKNKNIRIPTSEIYRIISNDSLLLEYESLFSTIASSNTTTCEQIIAKMILNGENIVTIVRNISDFLIKLLKLKTMLEQKTSSVDEVIHSFSPPIFFKQVPIFKKALSQHSIESLVATLEQITKFEIKCKTISMPKDVISHAFTQCLCTSSN